jgi:glutaredoxin
MSNKQAMWSVMAMLTIWCVWNTAKINNVKTDYENINSIVNDLVKEYQEEEKQISNNYEDIYFPQVFAEQRALYGGGHVFEWNGNTYTTDYKEEETVSTNGWVLNSDDYDDYCKSNYHDSCGVCDGNGPTKWFADRDGDGLGDSTTFIKSCDEPVASR